MSIAEQLQKDMRQANKEDRHDAELFEAMVKTEAWKVFLKRASAIQQGYSEELLAPSGGLDGLVKSEYAKGALGGSLRILSVPQRTMESVKQIGPQVNDEEDDEQ